MTLEQLRIFVVVAEHEHVTRASYELDMVQSAVSKVIATLEGELAIRLFDRVGRNIKLTPRGAAFRNKAIELIDHADRLRAWAIEVRDAPIDWRSRALAKLVSVGSRRVEAGEHAICGAQMQISHAITNLDGTFAEADEAYCEMLQLTSAELRKRDILSITFPADRASNGVSLQRLINQGTPFWIKKRYLRDDGSLVRVVNHVARTVGITGKSRIAAISYMHSQKSIDLKGNGTSYESLSKQTDTLKALPIKTAKQ